MHRQKTELRSSRRHWRRHPTEDRAERAADVVRGICHGSNTMNTPCMGRSRSHFQSIASANQICLTRQVLEEGFEQLGYLWPFVALEKNRAQPGRDCARDNPAKARGLGGMGMAGWLKDTNRCVTG